MVSPHQPSSLLDELVYRKKIREGGFGSGADRQIRTADLTLTKGALYQLSYISTYLERAVGIEPTSSAWKAEVIAIIRCPRPGTRLPNFSEELRRRGKGRETLNSSPSLKATLSL